MPNIATEEQQHASFINEETVKISISENPYIANKTEKEIGEVLRDRTKVSQAIGVVERLVQDTPLTEEQQERRRHILNAAKMFFQENFTPKAFRTYNELPKDSTEKLGGTVKMGEIPINKDKKEQELAEITETDVFQSLKKHVERERERRAASRVNTDITPADYKELMDLRVPILKETVEAGKLLEISQLDEQTSEAYLFVIQAAYKGLMGESLSDPDAVVKPAEPVEAPAEQVSTIGKFNLNLKRDKVKKQVDEVVESDYFQELLNRKEKLREKHKS